MGKIYGKYLDLHIWSFPAFSMASPHRRCLWRDQLLFCSAAGGARPCARTPSRGQEGDLLKATAPQLYIYSFLGAKDTSVFEGYKKTNEMTLPLGNCCVSECMQMPPVL